MTTEAYSVLRAAVENVLLEHHPVKSYIGEWTHDDIAQRRRVEPLYRTPAAVLDFVEAHLPEHQEDERFGGCGDCTTELSAEVCAFCGGGLDEDGEWRGWLWPCPTYQRLTDALAASDPCGSLYVEDDFGEVTGTRCILPEGHDDWHLGRNVVGNARQWDDDGCDSFGGIHEPPSRSKRSSQRGEN